MNTNGLLEKTRAAGTSRKFESAGKEAMDYNVEGFTKHQTVLKGSHVQRGRRLNLRQIWNLNFRVRYTAVVKGGGLGGMIHQAHTTSTMYTNSTILTGSSNLELICTRQYFSTNTDT